MKKEVKIIAWFKELHNSDVDIAGGKGASLGEMFNAKLPIPPGFVVTAQAYGKFIEETGIKNEIISILKDLDVDNTDKLQKTAEVVQDLIKGTEIPNDIKEEIYEAYNTMYMDIDVFKSANKETLQFIKAGRDLPYVAVRSSATAEDLPSISKDEHILVKINNRTYFRKMEEIYDLVGDGYGYDIEIPAMKNNQIQWIKVESLYKHKVKKDDKLYKIITETGREIIVSPNHTLIVLDEDRLEPKEVKSIHNLNGNEKLPAINKLPILDLKQKEIDVFDYVDKNVIFEEEGILKIKNNSTNWKIQNGLQRKLKITKDFAYFLGVYCAEGTTYKENEIIITNSDEKVMKRVIDYISSLNLYNNQKINKNSLRFYNKTLVKFLNSVAGKPDKNIKGKGKVCKNKKVPEFVFGWNEELISEFLKGCFDGDGHVGKNILQYSSTSKLLISGIIKLLEMSNIEWYLREYIKSKSYEINIQPYSYENFYKSINFEIDYKRERLNNLVKKFKAIKNHPEFLNNLSVSENLSNNLRSKLENNLTKEKVITHFCPICEGKLALTSYYKNKIRYICKINCHKTFYEKDTIKKEVNKVINYDSKGKFVKNKIPWNKGYLSKRYGFKQFKKLINKNNISFDSLHNSVKWDEIRQIKEIDYDDYVYDFSVPEIQNFAAGVGGIITHNSASFAGQQETFLNIKGKENVLEATRRCWASLYTARAIYYRIKNNFPHEKVFIAVVVQKMVNSDKAGVMFSINPASNDESEIVIEAGWGLGDAVVSGSISPDNYIVDKKTLNIKNKKIMKQAWMMTRDVNLGRTVKRTLDDTKSSAQVLTEDEIVKLADLARYIEQYYKKPQDMEFAIEGNKIYIVQARPVTTYKKPEAKKEGEVERKIEGEKILNGLGASPGVAQGTVKILHDINELDKVLEGDVLVATMTNPDFVPAMKRAKAIVTDEGGLTCFEGSTKVLTNKGFMEIREATRRIIENEELFVLSYDYKNFKTKWKKILNAGSRVSKVIRVCTSQKGNMSHNYLDLTPDHRMITFKGRNLIKKEINKVIKDKEMLCLVDKLPKHEMFKNPKLAYLNGAILSDGHVKIDLYKGKNPRRGSITLTQKQTENKKEFIDTFKSYFYDVFGGEFKERQKEGNSYLRGRLIQGTATDFTHHNLKTALFLNKIHQNLDSWCLQLDELSNLNFLAGLIDGDGSFYDNRLHIYISKEHILQGVVIACLNIGIVPQVTVNRNIHHVQILERMEDILQFCRKIKINSRPKLNGAKLFSAKQLLGDIIEEVNWKGKIRPYVNNNLLIDSRKILDRILPIAKNKDELLKVLNSSLRMHRVSKIQDFGENEVFNLEVEADNEMDRNYVVFTKKYTPLLVSNSHAAIVSREMGIVCVVGTLEATKKLKDGDIITVDGNNGTVYLGKVGEEKKEKKDTTYYDPNTPTKTKIYMNLGEPEKIEGYKDLGFDGIGLMRIEFIITSYIRKHPLYMIKEGKSQEYVDKLAEGVSIVAETINPKPMIVRFSDFKTNEYKNLEGGAEFEPHEQNPMIGWRGVSRYVSEEFIEAFKLECQAIKKVREKSENVHVMLPFVRNVEEVGKCLEIMKSEGLVRSEKFKVYLMAEVPAMSLIPSSFAKLDIDGASIGSNDLTQLVLGVSRDNAKLSRMGYFDERNKAVKIAILRLIRGFHKHGKTLGICGQAPSTYPEIVEFLVKNRIDSISVSPDVVNKVRNSVAKLEKEIDL